jgi:orotate phosphoribosyltransferase-like protein
MTYTSDKLLRDLDLTGEKIENLSANAFISNLWDVCEIIWEEVDLINYTNHDLMHSVNIISFFTQFDSTYHWSKKEKLIFAAAALVHDVGMQYNSWAPKERNLRDLILPNFGHDHKLSDTEIRKNHVEIAHNLCKVWENGSVEGLPAFSGSLSFAAKNALFHVRTIAAAHSGTKYLSKMFLERETWKTYPSESDDTIYRPRVLAAMLRLCDELDGNYLRIPNAEKIYTWNLDDVSRVHWLACLFVKGTHIEIPSNKKDEIRIVINWQSPEELSERVDDDTVTTIKSFVRERRFSKIRYEIERISEFLFFCGENDSNRVYKIEPLSQRPALFSFHMRSEFNELITKAIENKQQLSIEDPPAYRIHPLISELDPLDFLNKPELTRPTVVDKTLEQKLQSWVEENAEKMHVELVNNEEHTNTYFNCRSLASEQSLIRELADKMSSDHFDHNIGTVLGVGTSAIPLAVNIALRLDCASTFTLYRNRILDQFGESEETSFIEAQSLNYNFVEVKPIITSGKNLLIIDDVISGGRVAKEVLDMIDELGIKVGKIYHHTIFRLGQRECINDPRIEQYGSVMHIENVEYHAKKDCKPFYVRDEPIIKEKEML